MTRDYVTLDMDEHEPSPLWRHVLGETVGFLALASGKRIEGQKKLTDFQQVFFVWPLEEAKAIEWTGEETSEEREVYWCVHLLSDQQRSRGDARPLQALYVDGDGATVPEGFPQPTAIVESSPGRHHYYWRLSEPVSPARGAEMNRKLAFLMGADKGGWDLTQLLRVPGTSNFKYLGAPTVKVLTLLDEAYDPDELQREIDGWPPVPLGASDLAIWQGEEVTVTNDGEVDRSQSLWSIAMVLRRAGVSQDAIAKALEERDSALGWDKYGERPEQYEVIARKVTGINPKLRLELVRASELDDSQVEWLIDGLMPKEGLGTVRGDFGTGKSTLLLDWSCSIAAGLPWNGHAVTQAKVIYLFMEGRSGLKKRLAAWALHRGVAIPDLAFLLVPVNFRDSHVIDELEVLVRNYEPGLIVVDTLNRAMPGGDENTQRDMGELIAGATRLQQATGSAVWFAHHNNKKTGEYRGSSVLPSSLDTFVALNKGKNGLITLHCDKQRDAEPFAPVNLRLLQLADSIVLSVAEDAHQRASLPLRQESQILLDTLREAGNSGLRHGAFLSKTGLLKSVFEKRRIELATDGLIIKDAYTGEWKLADDSVKSAESIGS